MDNDSKIININSRRKKFDDNNDMNGFEDWEEDYNFISKGDYTGLKRHRLKLTWHQNRFFDGRNGESDGDTATGSG